MPGFDDRYRPQPPSLLRGQYQEDPRPRRYVDQDGDWHRDGSDAKSQQYDDGMYSKIYLHSLTYERLLTQSAAMRSERYTHAYSHARPTASVYSSSNSTPIGNRRPLALRNAPRITSSFDVAEDDTERSIAEQRADVVAKSSPAPPNHVEDIISFEARIADLTRLNEVQENLISTLNDNKKVQDQKVAASKIRLQCLADLEAENTRLREQNTRLRIDIVNMSHELNHFQTAVFTAEDGSIKRKLVKYRRERDLAREKLAREHEEHANDTNLTVGGDVYLTRARQVDNIGEDGFTMYDHLKARGRKRDLQQRDDQATVVNGQISRARRVSPTRKRVMRSGFVREE